MRVIILVVSLGIGVFAQTSVPPDRFWAGSFDFGDRGTVEALLYLDQRRKAGQVLFPYLIRDYVRINDVCVVENTVRFTIRFRSGPAFAEGVLEGDRLAGTYFKDGIGAKTFRLVLTDRSTSRFKQRKPGPDVKVSIRTFRNTPAERETALLLSSVLNKYDLERFLYTKQVRVMQGVIPHSHPVLTLHTADKEPSQLLATFLHEQMHWYALANNRAFENAARILRKMYPNAPYRHPMGSGSVGGTYRHIVINFLEYRALRELIGPEDARAEMIRLENNHYKWIYKTVRLDYERIRNVVEEEGLVIPTH